MGAVRVQGLLRVPLAVHQRGPAIPLQPRGAAGRAHLACDLCLPVLHVDPRQEAREVQLQLVPQLGPWAARHSVQPGLLAGWHLEHRQQWDEAQVLQAY